jgi:hypothetical protein
MGFRWCDFPQNQYVGPKTYLLQTVYCSLRLVVDYIRGRQICDVMFSFNVRCSLELFQTSVEQA